MLLAPPRPTTSVILLRVPFSSRSSIPSLLSYTSYVTLFRFASFMEKNEPNKNNKRPNEEGQGGKAPKAPRLNEEGKSSRANTVFNSIVSGIVVPKNQHSLVAGLPENFPIMVTVDVNLSAMQHFTFMEPHELGIPDTDKEWEDMFVSCYPFLQGLNRVQREVLQRDGSVSLLFSLKRKLVETAQQRGLNAHSLRGLNEQLTDAENECQRLREHLNCIGCFGLDAGKLPHARQGKADRYYYHVNSDLSKAEKDMGRLSGKIFLCRMRELELSELYKEILVIIDALVPVLEQRTKMVKLLKPIILEDSDREDECNNSMDITQ